ncbi:MAG: metallophosphoesterase [Planctomycetes bacterium]|nr:metallophosphoesterase [Planctomycetota bacterium]
MFKVIPLSPSLLVAGANCLAVEVHQSSVTSNDISFDLELIGETLLKVSRAPYLQLGTPQGATVCWRTNGPTSGRVRYGPAPGSLNLFADDPVVQNDHQIAIAGLLPGSVCYYSVGTTSTVLAGDDAEHRFVTAPPPGTEQPVRVWVLGDSGTADSHAAAVRDAYLAYTGATPTDLWLMLGDNAYFLGSDSEYQAAVFDTYPQVLRKSVLWPTRGNHEKDAAVHYGIFVLPAQGEAGGTPSGTEAFFSFDHANVHFICLDSTGSDRTAGGPMWTWLQQDLAATAQHWIIAFWHHPPYSKGSHDSDTETTMIEMRQNFLPLLEAGGADLVLTGHSHAYERSYFIDGHYGDSTTFAPAHLKDDGGGKEGTDGPYVKAAVPHAGAVHAVVGCSGKLSTGPLNHPAMHFSRLSYGSALLDVDGDRLDAVFLDDQGQILDQFTLRSFPNEGLTGDTTALSVSAGGTQSLALDSGAGNAGKPYFLVGSMSGTEPGLPLGALTLPLVPDWYMVVTIQAANSTVFASTFGALDGAGAAAAAVNLAPGLAASFVGTTLCHAYVVFDPPPASTACFASNPFPLTLLP